MENKSPEAPFVTDVKELRRRAREHIEDGAVTARYRGDPVTVVRLLNEALATELVSMLRYRRHHFMAHGGDAKAAADQFLAHSFEEQGHADRIAYRITQLNGAPNLNPDGLLLRAHSEYVEGGTLIEMIRENLIAERVAIDAYSEVIRYLGNNDVTTRRMLEDILAMKEEHAENMNDLLANRAAPPLSR